MPLCFICGFSAMTRSKRLRSGPRHGSASNGSGPLGQSQPFCLANRYASMRLATPSLPMHSDR